jgi:uncharacterized protein (DUF2336 family)
LIPDPWSLMPVSLIPELEDVIQRGSPAKRADALARITTLFLDGAGRYNEAHVGVFDDVFGLLIEEIETKARAALSRQLAPVSNAPVKVLSTLAHDDDIAVAGPVLKYAPRLAEADLVDVARTKSQAHLQAICGRPALGEAVTDVLVHRGDRDVACSVADNRGARISQNGFLSLVKRAENDGVLAEKVGLRPDIPAPMFRELLSKATAVVRNRLIAAATANKAEITRVVAKVSEEVGARVGPRDYGAAQRVVLSLERAGRLDEQSVAAFCADGKFEETVVALAALAKVPVAVADRLLTGDRPDPVLILCRAVGFNWSTVRAIILLRPDARIANPGLDAAFANFERLSTSTARRVVRFWQVRQAG